jgi:N-acetylmuramoyl-L-alanine amidase
MKTLLIYLLQMIITSGLLYGYYHFFLRNKKFHRYNRYYLLMGVVVSIVIPFLNIPVYFSQEATDNSVVLQTLNVISSSYSEDAVIISTSTSGAVTGYNWFRWQNIFFALYLLFVLVFIIRVILSIRKIKIITASYPTEKIGDINFVNTTEPGTPFSFFRWLFWNKEIELDSDKGQQIFRHELFHINQKHSYDIFLMELVTAFAWFNPFFHLIKKELKIIHEFLADEYAMHKVESWQYAELLLMQALNTKHHLVNPFFHNQIRRRIAMITTSQKPGHQYLRKLLVLPVAAVIAALFAFSYKSKNAINDIAVNSGEPITIVVDAGHGGTDNGAKGLDGKTTEAALTLEISKLVKELSPEYNINVVLTREDNNFPEGAKSIQEGLKKRVEIAHANNASAFISIHINTSGKPGEATSKTGFDSYITDKRKNSSDKALASVIINEVIKFYQTEKTIKTRASHGIFVLDNNTVPSVILECGYITNPKDFAFITDKTNQEKIARAILSGVSKFAKQHELQKAISEKIREQIEISKTKGINNEDTSIKLIVTNGIVY